MKLNNIIIVACVFFIQATNLSAQKNKTEDSKENQGSVLAKEQHAAIGVDESKQKSIHTLHSDAQ